VIKFVRSWFSLGEYCFLNNKTDHHDIELPQVKLLYIKKKSQNKLKKSNLPMMVCMVAGDYRLVKSGE
jgi:hypothetical protein